MTFTVRALLLLRLAAIVAVLAAVPPVSQQAAASPGSGATLSENPGAETGDLGGWAAIGFSVLRYGSSGVAPSTGFADANGLGSALFGAGQYGATMTQRVDVRGMATSIDAGTQAVGVYAMLGGASPGTGNAYVTVRFLDGDERPVGDQTQVGPPTVADRGATTGLVECRVRTTAPRGARTAVVAVHAAEAGALADNVRLSDDLVVTGVGAWDEPAQGPNCFVTSGAAVGPGGSPPVSDPPATSPGVPMPGGTHQVAPPPGPSVVTPTRPTLVVRSVRPTASGQVLRVALRLDAEATVRLALRSRDGSRLGTLAGRRLGPGAHAVRLRLTSLARRLTRRHAVGARLRVTIRTPSGQRASVVRAVRLPDRR